MGFVHGMGLALHDLIATLTLRSAQGTSGAQTMGKNQKEQCKQRALLFFDFFPFS
jgi:hypothetical protein